MNWANFKAAVLVDLPVDSDRVNVATGTPNFLDHQLLYAVIQIQQLIPFYRGPHETVYSSEDLVVEGLASVGSLPQGQQCRPQDAFYKKIGKQCVSQPMQPYPWAHRYDLVCGNPRIVNCQFLMTIDPWGQQFTVFPSVGCFHQISLFWEGVKTSFDDSDETPFDMDVVECVGLFVKSKIARLVDHDLAEYDSYQKDYMRRRSLLFADSNERRRLNLLSDSPAGSNKCANSLSTCCRDGTGGTCHSPTEPMEDTIEFIAFGDSGDPNGIANTLAVSVLAKSLEGDFIMHMGDTNYPTGDPVTIQDNLLKYYGGYIPQSFYVAFGNHDIISDGAVALQTILTRQASLNSGLTYYDFIPRSGRSNAEEPLHIFVLDSNGDPAVQGPWLQARLATSSLWNVVVLHEAPYTSDASHVPGNANWRLPYETWGANLVLSGHAHNYERLLVNGLQYITCGLGGAPKRGFAPVPVTGSQFRYSDFYGCLYVTATEHNLQVSFYNTLGEVVDSIELKRCGRAAGAEPINPIIPPEPAQWCQYRGAPVPEGLVSADVGCWYRRSDGTNYEFWIKNSQPGTSFGWMLVTKLA